MNVSKPADNFQNATDGDRPQVIFVSVNDAAKALGIGRTRLYELLDANEIDSVRFGSRRLVLWSSIMSFADRLLQRTQFG